MSFQITLDDVIELSDDEGTNRKISKKIKVGKKYEFNSELIYFASYKKYK